MGFEDKNKIEIYEISFNEKDIITIEIKQKESE